MKALELERMESIEGGDAIGCIGGYTAVAGLLFGVAALSGPVGWAAVGAFAAGGFGAGLTIGSNC